MGTIKPYNVDEMRAKAAEHIHSMFRGAVMVQALYKDTYVKASCQWKDGVKEYVMVFYTELDKHPLQYGQHERAMAYINSMAV